MTTTPKGQADDGNKKTVDKVAKKDGDSCSGKQDRSASLKRNHQRDWQYSTNQMLCLLKAPLPFGFIMRSL